jgi:uncharacterized protein YrrD
MQFKEGADVLTPRGRKVGRIDRVVIDPESEAVTHLVVKKGLLFTTDKVIPVDEVDTTTEEQVLLKKSLNPDELPEFEETEYLPVGGREEFRRRQAEEARSVIWYHTRIRTPWWGLGPNPNLKKPLFIKEPRRNIPEGTVPLEEGAEVIDAEGQSLGEIQEVYTEPESNRVTHLLISRGTLSKDKKLIPTAWVKGIHEESVRLTVRQKVIDELPEPEEHPA